MPGSEEPTWVDYGDTGRQGLLSHGSFLSIGARENDTSPVARGKTIRERLMCSPIPPPPPTVDVDQTPDEGVCKVERFANHRAGGCEGCHAYMDPIGFGLENYDAVGRYREYEPDNPETMDVDESQCMIPGEGAIAGVGEFRGPAELSQLLLANGQLARCATEQLVRFVAGHSQLDVFDSRFIDAVANSATMGEFRFDDVLLAVVSDAAFRFRPEEGIGDGSPANPGTASSDHFMDRQED